MKKASFAVSLVLLFSGLIIVGTSLINITESKSKDTQLERKIKAPNIFSAQNRSCACCGSANPRVFGTKGKTTIKEGYQEATVKVSGGYQPETLEAKAGLPLRLSFTQGTSSCDSVIILPFANLKIDVSSGLQTVEIPPLKPGTYEYFCWMNMLKGRIVVK